MLRHEESREKPQFNMATALFLDESPHFALPHPFLAKIFRINHSINFEKFEPPPFMKGEGGGWGVRTMKGILPQQKCTKTKNRTNKQRTKY